jgi:hypothetical protein
MREVEKGFSPVGKIYDLDKQDLVEIRRPHNGSDPTHDYAVNFNSILRTGQVPCTTDKDRHLYNIEWTKNGAADDAFNSTLRTIEKGAAEKIRESPELQDLLVKEHWDKADRQQWEERVSTIVSDEAAKVPAFRHYRTSGDYPGRSPDTRIDAVDISRLNDLNADIQKGTEKMRFDCGVQSLVEGCVLQRIENSHLPAAPADKGDCKKASSYFYATGGAIFGHESTRDMSNHAAVFTPAGNIIESTASEGSPYRRSKYSDSTLEAYARGKPFYAENGAVYNQERTHTLTTTMARTTGEIEHAEGGDQGRIFKHDELMQRGRQAGTAVTEDADNGFMIVASRRTYMGKDISEIKVFQNQNIGTQSEGYVMVAYADDRREPGGKGPVVVRQEYQDVIDGHTYKFTAELGTGGAKTEIARKGRFLDDSLSASGAPYGKDELAQSKFASKQEAPAAAVAPEPESKQVAALQAGMKKMGLYEGPADGHWHDGMNKAMDILIVRAQLTEVYRQAGGTLDCTYGRKTDKAFQAMARLGQMDTGMVDAIRDMKKSGELDRLHVPSDDTQGVVDAVLKNPKVCKEIAAVKPPSRPHPSGPRGGHTPAMT